MKVKNISIIVPVLNEEGNIKPLIERIDVVFSPKDIEYEIIFVDDKSSDNTQEVISSFVFKYPVALFIKKGKKGKAQSLIEGFYHARFDTICMIDGDLQYPPEAIFEMSKMLEENYDVVVANRGENHTSFLRKAVSSIYRSFFGRFLHHLNFDVQSGLKVFKKEVIERISLHASSWDFDLEFLIKARDAGYKIGSYDIVFAKRTEGKTKVGILRASFQIGLSALRLKFLRSEIIPFHPKKAAIKGQGFNYKGQEFIHHSNLPDSKSAFHRLSGAQIIVLVLLFLVFVESFDINWHITIVICIAALTVLYFTDLLFNLFLIFRSFSKPTELQIADNEIDNIQDSYWPTYTVLCPLYKEWQVIPQFVNAMSNLSYPKDKLQVMLLLEEDDYKAIKNIRNYVLPSYFELVIVPQSFPKTKPKACNYGLKFAKGEYTVIYDAEDVPEVSQLKKSVIGFEKSDKRTICIQAKLNFYNPSQNLLTRVFTAEYSLWFDLVLTGLQSIHAPIPLGGTSNHFKTADLKKLKGWDSFNVTEDADLGMRLVKKGYLTAVINSTTLEEANSDMKNWFWQRTRWIKGYMQTYLLHMRTPGEFVKDWKSLDVITFQLVIGGKVLSMFINPIMWVITISYFAFRVHLGGFIESFFPTPILYMGVFSLIFGNFLYLYYYMIGCAKHGHHELTKYVFLVPFYWLFMSVASWVAFYELIVNPHHWSKTKHGLHLKDETIEEKTISNVPKIAVS
jgi:cellulose synthase/poly-beta-1,6-N-acetylglucosamine synthase-like glycosyltransferase